MKLNKKQIEALAEVIYHNIYSDKNCILFREREERLANAKLEEIKDSETYAAIWVMFKNYEMESLTFNWQKFCKLFGIESKYIRSTLTVHKGNIDWSIKNFLALAYSRPRLTLKDIENKIILETINENSATTETLINNITNSFIKDYID